VGRLGLAIVPQLVFLFSAAMFALEANARQVAEPFGTSPNNLALASTVQPIERALLEMCREPVLPLVSVEAH
jgi:putative membrane protein